MTMPVVTSQSAPFTISLEGKTSVGYHVTLKATPAAKTVGTRRKQRKREPRRMPILLVESAAALEVGVGGGVALEYPSSPSLCVHDDHPLSPCRPFTSATQPLLNWR